MADLAAWLLEQIAEDQAGADTEDRDYADTTLLPTYDSDHQRRWNTDRVLAECDAKRRVIELHTGEHECREMHTGTYPADWPKGANYGAAGEQWRHPSTEYFDERPCETLRLLALPYADRPGFREEWRR